MNQSAEPNTKRNDKPPGLAFAMLVVRRRNVVGGIDAVRLRRGTGKIP